MADLALPVSFTKNGVTEIATTASAYYEYLFDGWALGDAAPVPTRSLVSSTIRRIEFVEELPEVNPSPDGTLYLASA